jgi:hypothetical protein
MSKKIIASGSVSADEAFISFINLIGSGVGNIVVKDGDSTGDIIFEATINAGESSKFTQFAIPLRAKNGIYVELTNATITIGYFG